MLELLVFVCTVLNIVVIVRVTALRREVRAANSPDRRAETPPEESTVSQLSRALREEQPEKATPLPSVPPPSPQTDHQPVEAEPTEPDAPRAASPMTASGSEVKEEAQPTGDYGDYGDRKAEAMPIATEASSTESSFAESTSAETAPRERLEVRLGRLLPIIFGVVAFALAGLWLVKLFVEQGILGPERRIFGGALFAIALFGAGEWFRSRVERIASALVLTASIVGFVTVWSAQRLYGFIDPIPALLLEGALTAATLFLSRRFGGALSILGLIAGFLIPALIGLDSLTPLSLFGLLLLLQGALALDERVQKSRALGMLALFGSVFWFAAWLWTLSENGPTEGDYSVITAAYLLLSTFILLPRILTASFKDRSIVPCSLLIPGSILALAHYRVTADLFPHDQYFAAIGFAIFAASSLVYGRLTPIARPYTVTPIGLAWVVFHDAAIASEDRQVMLIGLVVITLISAVFPAIIAQKRRDGDLFWSSLATVTIGLVGLHWWYLVPSPDPLLVVRYWEWGGAILIAAVASLAFAISLARTRLEPGQPRELSRLEALIPGYAAIFLKLFGVWICFEQVEIGAIWSLLAVAIAFLDHRVLINTAGPIAAAILFAAGARLLLNPEVLHYPIGNSVVLNWITWGYGVPALACAIVAHRLSHQQATSVSKPWLVPALWGTSILLSCALVTLLVRQTFHLEAETLAIRWDEPIVLGEGLAYSITWIVFSAILFALSLWLRARGLRFMALTGIVLSVGKVFLWDIRYLEDLYRVASLFGLGLTLFAIGWAYYKLVPSIEDEKDESR